MSSMTTTLSLSYEGPSTPGAGYSATEWESLIGRAVHVPGLDAGFTHVLRAAVVSADRRTLTLTVDTLRPPELELARYLSVMDGPKAAIRTVHHETGAVLSEGAHYDAPLHPGQAVWINGERHVVLAVDWPGRVTGVPAGELDWQIATVAPQPPEQVAPIGGEA